MEVIVFHKIFLDIPHIQSKCGILSVPHNIVMDLNNVMIWIC